MTKLFHLPTLKNHLQLDPEIEKIRRGSTDNFSPKEFLRPLSQSLLRPMIDRTFMRYSQACIFISHLLFCNHRGAARAQACTKIASVGRAERCESAPPLGGHTCGGSRGAVEDRHRQRSSTQLTLTLESPSNGRSRSSSSSIKSSSSSSSCGS